MTLATRITSRRHHHGLYPALLTIVTAGTNQKDATMSITINSHIVAVQVRCCHGWTSFVRDAGRRIAAVRSRRRRTAAARQWQLEQQLQVFQERNPDR